MVNCDICKKPSAYKWKLPLVKFGGNKFDVGYCETHYKAGIRWGWLEEDEMVRC